MSHHCNMYYINDILQRTKCPIKYSLNSHSLHTEGVNLETEGVKE